MSPSFSVRHCPVCEQGLCGIRVCSGASTESGKQLTTPHGLVLCDECEAAWTGPDLSFEPSYLEVEDARCPVCGQPLWSSQSHWADAEEIKSLGWWNSVDRSLDGESDP